MKRILKYLAWIGAGFVILLVLVIAGMLTYYTLVLLFYLMVVAMGIFGVYILIKLLKDRDD